MAIGSGLAQRKLWADQYGRIWDLPESKKRLNCSYPGHRALREFVIWRDKVCQWCGTESDLIADHKRSMRNGGSHTPGNLQALCQRCNSRKVTLVDVKG